MHVMTAYTNNLLGYKESMHSLPPPQKKTINFNVDLGIKGNISTIF